MKKATYEVTITITVKGGSVNEVMNAAHNVFLADGLNAGDITVLRTVKDLDGGFEDKPTANLDTILG